MAQLPWSTQLTDDLAARKQAGRYRQQRTRAGEQGIKVIVDGQALLSFASNDYLGLANHPALKKAFINAVEQVGVGSGAAHLLTGHSDYHQQLAEAVAEFTGQEKVLLFSSGYQANIGVITGLMGRNDGLLQDKLNHASLLDGGRLATAKQYRYQHNDMQALAQRLQQTEHISKRLIISDGVFSMDGDLALLPNILQFANQHHAAVLIDDAHGFGVLGATGRGSCEYWQLNPQQLPIIMGTFGKAFGTAGAFVAADAEVIDSLVHYARSYIYSTAQPAAIAAATLASLTIVQQQSWRREKLHSLIKQFRAGAEQLGLKLLPSASPIQPIIIGDELTTIAIGNTLEKQGILVGVIRPPTVPTSSARLRITLSAAHDPQHIDQLLSVLEKTHVH